jgi:hypothetical protein
MKLHANAKLGPKGRLVMVRRVVEQQWSIAEAAMAASTRARRRRPAMMSQSQFLLRDVPPVTKGTKKNSAAYWFTYQSGLFTMPPEDKPKPAFAAYQLPLVATVATRSGDGGTVNLWGRLRFRPKATRSRATLSASSRQRCRRRFPARGARSGPAITTASPAS